MRIDLFLGIYANDQSGRRRRFQYPRADRLVFGDVVSLRLRRALSRGFSILVRIDLFLGAAHDIAEATLDDEFQYPRADRLVFGECQR